MPGDLQTRVLPGKRGASSSRVVRRSSRTGRPATVGAASSATTIGQLRTVDPVGQFARRTSGSAPNARADRRALPGRSELSRASCSGSSTPVITPCTASAVTASGGRRRAAVMTAMRRRFVVDGVDHDAEDVVLAAVDHGVHRSTLAS